MDEYYINYYKNQVGGGQGEDQFLQLKIPRVYQRGHGVGGIFSSLWRFLQPLLKKGATFASKELLETGKEILSGLSIQKPIKTIIADRSIQLVDKIRDKAADKIKTMGGAGSKRKRNLKSINIHSQDKKNHLVGHRQPTKKKKVNKNKAKQRIIDIFS